MPRAQSTDATRDHVAAGRELQSGTAVVQLPEEFGVRAGATATTTTATTPESAAPFGRPSGSLGAFGIQRHRIRLTSGTRAINIANAKLSASVAGSSDAGDDGAGGRPAGASEPSQTDGPAIEQCAIAATSLRRAASIPSATSAQQCQQRRFLAQAKHRSQRTGESSQHPAAAQVQCQHQVQ